MRIVRADPNRDESKPPSIDDCLAHRCKEHRDIPPIDDSEDGSGAECSICVGHKFVSLIEEKTEEHILQTILWPLVETARARLNLVALGSGESFVDDARRRVDEYRAVREKSEGEGHAEDRQRITVTAASGTRPGVETVD
ncbi:MAG TPA: hypothetical protein VHY33_03225 [Thermoanaerobaculia bacterium]|jgi:hypothetical protein|nr:hypothetical protein [Thermoanaerobaculia bacterium]